MIATKAITQTIGHAFKLIYYGNILYYANDQEVGQEVNVQLNIFPLAILCAVIGTGLGKQVLDKLSELQFQKYSRLAVGLIGGFYIIKVIIES